MASGCSLGRVVFLSQMTLPCFSCAWYQQSWVLNSLKTAERCFSGLRSAQRVSRCLPHTWVRSQIKGGKERSLCSQTPWCSGALAPHLDVHSVILKSWEVSVSGRRTQRIFFAREVRVTQSSVVYHPKSCSGGSCLAAFHEF